MNLYAFVGNDTVDRIDVLGRCYGCAIQTSEAASALAWGGATAAQISQLLDISTAAAAHVLRCYALDRLVKEAKEEVQKLGGCERCDDCATLLAKGTAWSALATARWNQNMQCPLLHNPAKQKTHEDEQVANFKTATWCWTLYAKKCL